MGKKTLIKEVVAEDFCFVCKEGGKLLICEYKDCLKVYHPQCVGKEESFLEGDESWSCGWHTCFICLKASSIHCLCCPKAFCTSCSKTARFVRVRKSKGFCSNCLNILISEKENPTRFSDGGNLNPKDFENPHILFMDYWRLINEEESITAKDIDDAKITLDNTKTDLQIYDPSLKRVRSGRHGRSRKKKRDFIGWGSVELIEFLTSLGKDTSQPLDRLDVSDIIQGYIRKSNLLPGKKKKTIFCDDKLKKLFRKFKVKTSQIYNLLEAHFAANTDQDNSLGCFLEGPSNLESGMMEISEPVTGILEGKFAAITRENLNLIYLRKSLILELLRDPQDFEGKVTGCYVRVKNEPIDVDFLPDKVHTLQKISGIKTLSDAYSVGGMSIYIVFSAFNCSKDIYISMLSDDDFQEEECEDFRNLIKEGLFERPTIAEFTEKLKVIHEDIVNHWIKRELLILRRKIERASEKGWYQEKQELIERRAVLQSEKERDRLKEIPRIIADVEAD